MPTLAALRPIIVIKEGNNGLGMQLRLVAGPISDAAAAAKICAAMIENDAACETTVYRRPASGHEGRRIAGRGANAACSQTFGAQAGHGKAGGAARSRLKKPDPPSTLSPLFGRR